MKRQQPLSRETMNIHIDTLPPYEAITCEPLRDAAAAFSAAKSEANARKRDTAALEQERPAVEWAQAEAIEAAQNAGKPAPARTPSILFKQLALPLPGAGSSQGSSRSSPKTPCRRTTS